MELILLSGGSGKRLWPLSNEARSKQFLRLLDDSAGSLQSMAQRVYGQLCNTGFEGKILISTNATQRDAFLSQIGDKISVLAEPERRDTFAAIALACSYLLSVKGCNLNEPIVVLPCDQYVDESYFTTIRLIGEYVDKADSDLVLMGIQPTYPSTKYGYIIPADDNSEGIKAVEFFKEKPNTETAKAYISQKALWNGGVFGFKLGYMKNIIAQYIADVTFDNVLEHFSKLPKISFDYEVVEKAQNVKVVPYSGRWEDLGTWASLLSEIKRDIIGKGVISCNCNNVHIINELSIPVLCTGVKDLAVIASYDGILVTDKIDSENIKQHVEHLSTRPLCEERRWGSYKVVDQQHFDSGLSQLTKQMVLNPGKSISYQEHKHRSEIWTIVDGCGYFVLDGHVSKVNPGDVLNIKAGQKHAIMAIEQLTIIEVQLGTELVESDIERFDWTW